MKKGKHNILFFISDLSGRGAEKVLMEVLKNFDYREFDVSLALVYKRGIYLDLVPDKVKSYYLFPCCFGLFHRLLRLLYALNMQSIFKWYINRRIPGSYDTGISFLEGIATKSLYLKEGVRKKIAWIHADLYTDHWTASAYVDQKEEEKVYRSYDKIVFVAKNARSMFNKRFVDIPFEKQLVIHNPLNKEGIVKKGKEKEIPNKKITFCSVGSLSFQKAYDRLLKVCSRLHQEGFIFEAWIVGTGDEENKLKEMMLDLQLEEVVYFWGFQQNPYPYINSADFCVSSSITEGFSLVVAEAMCLGKPIISTRTAGPMELLKDGEYGLLVENSEEGLYKGLKEMLSSDELRETYRMKAIEGSTQFSLDHSMGQIMSLIKEEKEIDINIQQQNTLHYLNRPDISIIVPVYNVELYLEKCLTSLLKQDIPYSEYEIIVVNDGSTDTSGEIINRFCCKYSSIILIEQENKGLSEARNTGLNAAKGKYIWFVDSDDSVENNVLKQLLGYCSLNDLDLLDFRFDKLDERGNLIVGKKYLPNFEMNRVVDSATYLNNYTFESGVWHYLFSHDFLKKNRLRFIPGIFHEDEEFTSRSLFFSSRIMVVENISYHYLIRRNSIITTSDRKKKEKKLRDMVFIVHQLNNVADSHTLKTDRMRRHGIHRRTRMYSIEIVRRLIEDRHSVKFSMETLRELVSKSKQAN